MACYHPIIRKVKNDFILLPCGHCIGCRILRAQELSLRCMHEAQMHDDNCVMTLTYDNEHVPHLLDDLDKSLGLTLNKKHPQSFVKDLRYHAKRQFKIFGCGEYGDKFSRPHYHLCIFGYRPPDCVFAGNTQKGFKQFTSEKISKIWGRGIVKISDFNREYANYVAGYCLKKVNGPRAEAHYQGREPEYSIMSRRPGIGKKWFELYQNDIYNYDICYKNEKTTCRPPRYYDKLLEAVDPERVKTLKTERIKKVDHADGYWRRLSDKEQHVIKSQLFFKTRNLEKQC